jgi:hypothetical protein
MKPKWFEIRELVGPDVYEARGERAWQLLDTRLLITLDQLREKFGPITVNNWHWGGRFKASGLRTELDKVGARFSQHRMGRAADCKFRDTTPREVFDYILAHESVFASLTCLEDVAFTPTWLHVDVRNTVGHPSILVVKP